VPIRTPFPISHFTSSLPFCLCAICPSFATSFVMGVVSAQRKFEIKFIESLSRRVVVPFNGCANELQCYARKIQGGSAVTSLQYARGFMTQLTSDCQKILPRVIDAEFAASIVPSSII
jgi:hypothetical protein